MLRHQQALHREIFVQVGPVDAQARANQAPVLSLRFGGALQSREPSQWDQQRAAVIQFHGQGVVRYVQAHGFGALPRFERAGGRLHQRLQYNVLRGLTCSQPGSREQINLFIQSPQSPLDRNG